MESVDDRRRGATMAVKDVQTVGRLWGSVMSRKMCIQTSKWHEFQFDAYLVEGNDESLNDVNEIIF